MQLATLVARLKSQLIGLKSIGGCADLDAAIASKPVTPAAFAIRLAERNMTADEDSFLSSTEEDLVQSFGVVHVVSNRKDNTGAAATDAMEPFCARLRTALVGWVPDATTGEPMRFAEGRMLRMDGDGNLWWIDEFRLKTHWSN